MSPHRPLQHRVAIAAGLTFAMGLVAGVVGRLSLVPLNDPTAREAVSLATAAALLLAAAALWLRRCVQSGGAHRASQACAVIVALIALANMGESGLRRGIPIGLLLIAAGVLTNDLGWRRTLGLPTWAALASAAVALTVMLNRLFQFQIGSASEPSSLAILWALPATIGLLALSAGLVMARPDLDFIRVFLGNRSTNRRARQLLAVILLAPPVFQFLRTTMVDMNRFTLPTDIAVSVALEMFFLMFLMVMIARTGSAQDQNLEMAEVTRDRVMAQAASLQQEVSRRTRELEMANANLHVVAQVNSLLALTTQHTPNGVIIANAEGTVLWTNPVWERLSGWNQAKSLGQPAERLLGAIWGESASAPAQKIFRDGRPEKFEVSCLGADGQRQWVRITIQPVRDQAQSGQLSHFIVILDDFTAYREADRRLQVANDRLQFALHSSGYGIWQTQFPENQVEWDERMAEIYGTSPDRFGGKLGDWTRLIHPDDAEAVATHRAQVVAGTVKNFDIDFRIVRPDGAVRYIEAHGFLVRHPNGAPDRLVGLNRDITAEIEMRDTLRVAEERLGLALLATNESVWDWNIKTGVIYRDRRWAELVGLEAKESFADISAWASSVHPEDLPAAQAALDSHLQGKTAVYMAEYRLRTKPGHWIWTLDRGKVVLRDKEGQPERMVGTQGDITARKKLDERLRHSEEISIQLGRLAQIGAWEWSLETQTLTWSPELYRICEAELGYTPTLGALQEFFPLDYRDVFMRTMEPGLAEGHAFDFESPMTTLRGRELWVRVIGRIEFKEGRAVRLFGAIQNITAQRDAEAAQRKLEGQLFQVQKMETLGTLAGGIAHDFNNLLTGILGYQELALDTLPEDHPSRSCLTEARNACGRAHELVEQILTFSRQTGGGKPVPLELPTLIEEARRFLRATVPATIQIEVAISPDCGRVMAEPTQLHQVLLNLGTNAAHAMRKTGGVLRIGLAPVTLRPTQSAAAGKLPAAGPYVCLSVGDTGHGMDAETQKRIFDPFFTTKEVGEGTGLGLAVVHGIVLAHGGTIEVVTAPGEGAVFNIYLPVAASDYDEIAPMPAAPVPSGHGELICILDDEQIVGQVARLSLERYNYRTAVFTTPESCLEALKKDPSGFAVLLSDHTMPGMTGMEMSTHVRTFAPRLPIVIMSGYFSKISPRALEDIGHIALLAKPFSMNELVSTVHRALHPEPQAAEV
jgi:PAS domain S-box-containing protein